MDLEPFVQAHDRQFETALAEIRSGQKRSHWIWYIFPQMAGLGRSPMSRRYALPDLQAARAFLAHPVLGEHLLTMTRALLELEESNPARVMGSPDDLKLRSCMTLFEAAAPGRPEFAAVLEKFYGGARDPRTLQLLKEGLG